VAWAIDDTGLLKCGTASPCVARQYTGTAGKVTNCQVAVSVSMVTDTASCPVDWQLFVPESWDPASPKASADVHERRRRAGIGDDIGHREKWRLALDMIDELVGWGRQPPLIVADCGYGDNAEFRHELAERRLAYAVQVSGDLNAYPAETVRTVTPRARTGRPPLPRYRDPVSTLAGLVTAAGVGAARRITWRQGSRQRGGQPQMMSSRFVFLRVRPAGRVPRRAYRGQDLPAAWLIAEWPTGAAEPVKYWLSNLPQRIAKRTLVRWRSCAGASSTTTARSRPASARTTTKAAAGRAGTTTPPSSPPRTRFRPCSVWTQAGMTLYAVLRRLQKLLARLIGTCPACRTHFPQRKPRHHRRL
jgi:SRSO17 transposase